MVGRILSDPIFQPGILGVLVGTIAGPLVLRTQVANYPIAVARGMRLVLVPGMLSLLLLTGWTGWDARSNQGSSHPASAVSSPGPSASPSPTPTPRLSRSITQALTARDSQTAWSMYTKSFQRCHSYTLAVTACRQYRQCSIPEQSYDPDAIALLTLTLASGLTDPYGNTGDTTERFTMNVEARAWKITQVCHVISEGCFALAWG